MDMIKQKSFKIKEVLVRAIPLTTDLRNQLESPCPKFNENNNFKDLIYYNKNKTNGIIYEYIENGVISLNFSEIDKSIKNGKRALQLNILFSRR